MNQRTVQTVVMIVAATASVATAQTVATHFQANSSGDTSYFAGKVAVGTNGAPCQLTVKGPSSMFHNAGPEALFIDGYLSGNDDCSFQFRRNSNPNGDRTIVTRAYSTHVSEPDWFSIDHRVGGAQVAVFAIRNNGNYIFQGGNVGINNTSPAQKLDVGGTAQAYGFRGSDAATKSYMLGYLGVGTNNPVATLHVRGPSSLFENQGSMGLLIDGYASGNDESSFQLRRTTDPNNDRTIVGRAYSTHVSTPDWFSIDHRVGGSQVAVFSIRANGNYILQGGNVGIGTTSPTAKLHVAGTARFDNGISYVAPLGDLSMGSFTNAP